MEYKTIVVHLDESSGSAARVEFAARLAADCKAHLVGMTQTGISRFIYQSAVPGADLSGLTPLFGQLRDEAQQRLKAFDDIARRTGVASFEPRIGDDEPATALAQQAMVADLVVVGRSHADEKDGPPDPAVPQYIAMNSPAPVLLLPEAGTPAPPFARILVAWNASPEAARAVRLALPFLVRAAEVDVTIFDGNETRSGAGGSAAANTDADIGNFLERHGVQARVRHRQARDDVGSALLEFASQRQADLLVMGCYGHSRLREIVLGGVSRTVLHRLTLPTLMAH